MLTECKQILFQNSMKDEMTLNDPFNISVTVKRLRDKCLQIFKCLFWTTK